MLTNVIYVLNKASSSRNISVRVLQIFSKRNKRTWLSVYLSGCQMATASSGKPPSKSKNLSCGARVLIKPAMVDPSKRLELMILFLRFYQRDSYSSLKFGNHYFSFSTLGLKVPNLFERHPLL